MIHSHCSSTSSIIDNVKKSLQVKKKKDKLACGKISLTKWSEEWRRLFQSPLPKWYVPNVALGMNELTSLIIWLEIKPHNDATYKRLSFWKQIANLLCQPRKMNPKRNHGPINTLKETVKCGKNPSRKCRS